jgi:hypothetical protein
VWLARRNTIKLSRVKQQEASYWRQEEKEGAGHVYRFVMEEEEAEDDGEEAAADMVVSLPLWWIGSSASRIRSVSGETGAFGERERERNQRSGARCWRMLYRTGGGFRLRVPENLSNPACIDQLRSR